MNKRRETFKKTTLNNSTALILLKRLYFFKLIVFTIINKQNLIFLISFLALNLLYFSTLIFSKAASDNDSNTFWATMQMFFGMFAPIIISLQIMLISCRLIVWKIDRGDMTYIVCTNTSRNQISGTCLIYLLFICVCNLLSFYLIAFLAPENVKSFENYWYAMNKLILGNFYLSLLLSGLSFLASCFFNKNAYYFLIIGTIFVFSGVCNILSFMATQMDDLKSLQFFSFFTLSSLVGVEELFTLAVNNYDIEVITKPSAILYLKNIACICAGIVALISSLFIFRIRDLPL